MVQQSQIMTFCERIVRRFHPALIIMFGSYGYGHPTDASDVDLLVMLPFEEHSARKAKEILNATDPRFPVDLLVRTPQQIQQRLALNDWFIRDIWEKGRILNDAGH